MDKITLQNLDDINNFAILQNGVWVKGQKVYKHVRDQRSMEANERFYRYQRIKMNPKAFAIPIQTGLGLDYSQNRNSKCFLSS